MSGLPPLRTPRPAPALLALRLPEAARTLGLSTRTVRRLIETGELEASRVGRVLLIQPRAIEVLLERSKVGRMP